jgi:hypothetical protein
MQPRREDRTVDAMVHPIATPAHEANPSGPDAAETRPRIDLPECRNKGIRHVGVVFVHGIGAQEQGEILRDWGGAIARVLVDFRIDAKQGGDPVLTCQLDPATEGTTFVELQVPGFEAEGGKTVPEEHWILTEAWWAHDVTPPSFGQMAQWLGPDGAVPQIVKTIIPHSTGEDDPRRSPSSIEPGGTPLPDFQPIPTARVSKTTRQRLAEAAASPSVGGLWNVLGRAGAWVYLQAFSALLLLLYGTLRSIEAILPIGPLKDGALTKPIDRFVLEWFGDVFVLLGVPAEAASVRGRLARSIRSLMEADCDQIVVIAHSGGAIVAWTTLVDDFIDELHVDMLVTIGEGLNLGWNITSGEATDDGSDAAVERARKRFPLLYEPLMNKRKDLRWVDYWGSRDPAPSGWLTPPQLPLEADTDEEATLRPHEDRFTNIAIWNVLSSREDHGAYWDNDEEFVIPLLRRLEGDRGAAASFFGPIEAHDRRSKRRRRRLSVLSLWKQLCLMGPTAAIITAYAWGRTVIPELGDTVAGAWSVVPGSQIISGPINAIRGAQLDVTYPPINTLAEVGVWVVAGLIASAAWFALISPPERSTPWQHPKGLAPNIIGFLVRTGPLLAIAPLALGVGIAAGRFIGNATEASVGAVRSSVPLIGLLILVVIVVSIVSQRYPVVRVVATAVVLAVASYVVVAPIAATLIFVDVGRIVLGSLAVIAGFGILAKIGTWRWSAWDLRERLSGHAREPRYEGVGLVAVQCMILLTSLALFYVAVGWASKPVAGVAVVLVLVAILVGIAIDVNHAPAGADGKRTKIEGYIAPRRL